ncbi:Glycosyltransferase involved in cell wall bisynthesis [Lachnospiraceae bacterium G11]|nr:Glycosyltransferase involved in cell wall bisynthesis [Lachnospiraceae bacterium G11]
MKKITVLVTCYNEEKSIKNLYDRVSYIFNNVLINYDYEVVFCDNDSKDNTQSIIRDICAQDGKCKAVFNTSNFGFHRNIIQSFQYVEGDAAFLVFGDLQDPPELLTDFVEEWENGAQCVVGQRSKTDERGPKRVLRSLFYSVTDILAQRKLIHNMNGFGLYDRSFVDTVNEIEEVAPYFKSVIDEYGGDIRVIRYKQNSSARGKSNFNFWSNYDFSMYGITSSTKMLMRIATFIGSFVAFAGFILAIFVLIKKVLFWDSYPVGNASTIIVVLALGGIQLLFIGILGEYILTINERISRKPRCSIKEKINFDFGERINDGEKGILERKEVDTL